MTYKEKLKEIIGNNPDVFGTENSLMVRGCPGKYFRGACTYLYACRIAELGCPDCWEREYMGEKYIGEYPRIDTPKPFNFEDWQGKEVVMHCKTEEEAQNFCRVMHEAGKKWFGGGCYIDTTLWSNYKESTCYNFNIGSYDNMDYYNKHNYTILEWSDYMQPTNNQPAKSDAGKPRLSLVPMQIVWDIAEIRNFGVEKYGDPENWRKVELQRYIDALLRHTLAFVADNQSVDEESGFAHYKHMECNMAFISAMMAKK